MTIINAKSRAEARKIVAEKRSLGFTAKVVDNGAVSTNRWHVEFSMQADQNIVDLIAEANNMTTDQLVDVIDNTQEKDLDLPIAEAKDKLEKAREILKLTSEKQGEISRGIHIGTYQQVVKSKNRKIIAHVKKSRKLK